MSTLAGNLAKRTLVVPLTAAKPGMKKGHKGPIPVAESGDLPPSTPVVTLSFAKKHWGKGVVLAGALGVGALVVHKARRKNVKHMEKNKPNLQIAVIGALGSGKTTLIRLLNEKCVLEGKVQFSEFDRYNTDNAKTFWKDNCLGTFDVVIMTSCDRFKHSDYLVIADAKGGWLNAGPKLVWAYREKIPQFFRSRTYKPFFLVRTKDDISMKASRK